MNDDFLYWSFKVLTLALFFFLRKTDFDTFSECCVFVRPLYD